MKETTTINLGGMVFHIDQDAFLVIQKYFSELKKRFGINDEGKEIIDDIELRIAEILQDFLGTHKQAITQVDIEQVIEIMGHPEDIEGEETPFEQPRHKYFSGKQIYRDTDNAVFGGVCSGLSYYCGCPPTLIRTLTAVFSLFYGVGLLIYAVLWAFVPKAITTSQKLEMKGEPINAKNIKRTITESYENLKNSKNYRKTRETVNSGISALGKIIQFFLKTFLIIFGVAILIGAIVAIVALANLFIFHTPNVYINGVQHSLFLPLLESVIENQQIMFLFIFSIIFLVLIPMVAIIFIGMKLIFKFNTNNKVIGLTALALWLVALSIIISTGISMKFNLSHQAENTELHQLVKPKNKTMYIDLKDKDLHLEKKWASFRITHDIDFNQSYIYDRPNLKIERSKTGNFELEIQKLGRSNNYKSASTVAKNIRYEFEQKDSLLFLSPWFKADFKYIGRADDVDLTLYIPDGYSIFFYKEIYPMAYYIRNLNNISIHKMMGKKWTMTTEGLTNTP